MELREFLKNVNIKPHNPGYYYIIQAVRLLKDKRLPLVKITEIYKEVAKGYKIRPQSVERAIRHAREKGQYALATNSELLYDIAEKVQRVGHIICSCTRYQDHNDRKYRCCPFFTFSGWFLSLARFAWLSKQRSEDKKADDQQHCNDGGKILHRDNAYHKGGDKQGCCCNNIYYRKYCCKSFIPLFFLFFLFSF